MVMFPSYRNFCRRAAAILGAPSQGDTDRAPSLMAPAGMRLRKSRAAFSLVECVLALGVVGFAFVSLVGVIPVGLNTFRSAIDGTVSAQISQRVVAEARQAKFTELLALNKNSDADSTQPVADYFFDDEGVPVAPPLHIYEASVVVHYTSQPPVNGAPLQFAADAGTAPMAVVRTVVRRVTEPDSSREFVAVVPNNGW